MAQNVIIAGASYSNVPAVDLPKVGGGTARFADLTETLPIGDNLLENWYFVDPINQRGQSSYTGGRIYSIDRWLNEGSPITVTVQADSILVATSSSDGYTVIQFLTTALQNNIAYTMSILYSCPAEAQIRLSDGSSTRGYASLPVSSTKNLVSKTYTFTSGNPVNRFEIRPGNNSSVTIYAVKIEQSSQQTLAHQENGSWVLNEIPNKAAQTLLCQTSTADASDTYANKVVFPPNAITAGGTPVMCNPSSYTNSTKNYEDSGISLTITKAGTYRFKWDLVGNRNGAGTNLTAYSKLYVNGVAQGTEKSISGTSVSVVSQDLTVNVGDVVSIWLKMANTTYTGKVSMLVACINGDNGF